MKILSFGLYLHELQFRILLKLSKHCDHRPPNEPLTMFFGGQCTLREYLIMRRCARETRP